MHVYPGLGMTGDFTPGEDGWSDEMNANLLKLSVTGQLTVLSIVSAVPGSPTDGDIHLMADDAGANPNEIAVRDDGAWVYFIGQTGWRLFNADTLLHMILIDGVWTEVETGGGGGLTDAPSDGDTYGRKDGAWVAIEAGTAAYRAGSFFTTTPGADEVLMDHPATDEFTLSADLVGSVFLVGVNPTVDTTFSLQVDEVEVGTIEVTSGGVVTFDTAATPVVVAVDSHLTLVGPADANDIAGCAWTFRGTVAAVGGGGMAFSGARVYNGADYARSGGTNEAMLDTTATVEYDTDSWWDSVQQGFVVPAGVSYVMLTAQRAITSGTVGLRLGIDGAASLAALIGDTTMTFLQGTSGVIAVTPGDLLVPMTFGSGGYTLQGDDIGWTWAEIRAIG